jgi:hypothetical protein
MHLIHEQFLIKLALRTGKDFSHQVKGCSRYQKIPEYSYTYYRMLNLINNYKTMCRSHRKEKVSK